MLFCAVALMLTASCNSNSSSDKEKMAIDSLCYLMGTREGTFIKQQMKQSVDASQIINADISEGAKLAMNVDTNNVSFYKGLKNGLNLYFYIPSAKGELNIDLDKDRILEAYEKAVNAENDIMDPARCQEKISAIIEHSLLGKGSQPKDSLNYYLGLNFGIGAKQEIKYSPDSANFNGEELIKATKQVLNNESFSFIVGVGAGIEMNERISAVESQLEIKLDKDLVLDSFNDAVNNENEVKTSISEIENRIGNLLNQLNNKETK